MDFSWILTPLLGQPKNRHPRFDSVHEVFRPATNHICSTLMGEHHSFPGSSFLHCNRKWRVTCSMFQMKTLNLCMWNWPRIKLHLKRTNTLVLEDYGSKIRFCYFPCIPSRWMRFVIKISACNLPLYFHSNMWLNHGHTITPSTVHGCEMIYQLY